MGKVRGGGVESVVDAAEAFFGSGGGEVAVVERAVVGVGMMDQVGGGEGSWGEKSADSDGDGMWVIKCAEGVEVDVEEGIGEV